MERGKKSSTKNAAASMTMSLLAGAVARFLAKMSPDKAKAFLKDPQSIMGIKIPGELTSVLGGGLAGLTVVEILKRLVPGIGNDTLDYIQDFAVMVGDELEDVIKLEEKTPADTVAGGGGKTMKIIPGVWVSDDPLVGFADQCRLAHHLEEIESGKRRRAKGEAEKNETKFAVRNGFRQIGFDVFVLSGGTPPPAPEPGCTCRALLEIDRIEYEKQQAAPKAGDPKAEKPSTSFSTFIGKARRDKIKGLDAAKIDRFLDLFVQLPLDKRIVLSEVDNEDEFVAVVLARNLEEMIRLIAASKDKMIVNGLSAVLNIPADVIHGAWSAVRELAKSGGIIATNVPKGARAVVKGVKDANARVTASAGKVGDSVKCKRKIHDFAWKHNIKDCGGFVEWVIAESRDIKSVDIAAAHERFGERS